MNRFISGELFSGSGPIPFGSILLFDSYWFCNLNQLEKNRPIAVISDSKFVFSHVSSFLQRIDIPIHFVNRQKFNELKRSKWITIDIYNDAVLTETVQQQELPILEKELYVSDRKIEILTSLKGEDIQDSFFCGADGVGLISTEFLFYDYPHLTEEIHYSVLDKIFANNPTQDYTIRLFDINFDKLPKWVDRYGYKYDDRYRGIHLLFEQNYQELLRLQIAAIAKLSKKYSVSLLIPYIGNCEDILTVKKIIDSFGTEKIQIGGMIETCAAVYEMEEMSELLDFFSIGSNDFVQSFFGVDRTNILDLNKVNLKNKDFWRYFATILTNAKGKDVRICGQLPILPGMLSKLIDMGYSKFTVSPYFVQHLKRIIDGKGAAEKC